jgi:hypothetical protein
MQSGYYGKRIMNDSITVICGLILLVLAVVNPILINEHLKMRRADGFFLKFHAIVGWVFVLGFLGLFTYMVPRLGYIKDLPFFAVLHVYSGLIGLPLVLAKVLVARRYKNQSRSLPALGLMILVATLLTIVLSSGVAVSLSVAG